MPRFLTSLIAPMRKQSPEDLISWGTKVILGQYALIAAAGVRVDSIKGHDTVRRVKTCTECV